MREALACIVIYIIGAWISKERCAELWVVGPVFGAVVVLWDIRVFRLRPRPKHLAFMALSTLIYALVFTIADADWGLEPEWLEWLAGSLSLGVAAGSVLLAAAHRRVLGGAASPLVTAATLIVSFYLVTGLGGLLDRRGLAVGFDYYTLAIYMWQGIYLGFFYAGRLRKTL